MTTLFTRLLAVCFCVMAISADALAAKKPAKDRAFSTALQAGQRFAITSAGCRLSIAKNTASYVRVDCFRKAKVKTGSARIALQPNQYGVIRAQSCNLSVTIQRVSYVDVQCVAASTPLPVDTAPVSIVSTPISSTPTATQTPTPSPTNAPSGVVNGTCYNNGVDTGELINGNGFCSVTGLMYENGAPANSVVNGVLYQNGAKYDGVYKGGLYDKGLKVSVDGSLDTQTFQGRGYVQSDAGIKPDLTSVDPVDVVVSEDGAITALGFSWSESYGGYFVLTRYLQDGTIDTSFGQNGVVDLSAFSEPVWGGDLFFSNNKYVIHCWTRTLRLNYDGSLDQSFAKNGVLDTPKVGSLYDQRFTVPLSDGSMIVGAYGPFSPLTVARFTKTGDIDQSFGSNGQVTIPRTAFAIYPASHSDGKLTLSVWYDSGSPKLDPAADSAILMQLNADGSLNNAFGTNGQIAVPGNRNTRILPLSGGRILGLQPMSYDAKLIRFLANGQVDMAYGTNGEALIPSKKLGASNGFSGTLDQGSFTLLEDERVVVGGATETAGWLARFTAGGTLDTNFGRGDGTQLVNDSIISAVATAPDGRLVGAAPGQGMVIFRLWE